MISTRKLYDDKPKWYEFINFSTIIRGVSILSIFVGLYFAGKVENELLSGFIFLSAIVAAIWWWALALIVDACTKYLLQK